MGERPRQVTVSGYNGLPSAMTILPFASSVVAFCLVYACHRFNVFSSPEISTEVRAGRVLFIAYLGAFLGMWAVYFLSRRGPAFFSIRTLRRLLFGTTQDWAALVNGYLRDNTKGEADLKIIEDQSREKGRASLTNIGMLIGAATLELGQITSVGHWSGYPPTPWTNLMLGIGSVTAVTALACFVVAADSLDSLFNRFREPDDRHILIRYFYIRSLNPRYFGLMCLLVAAPVIIADISPCIGAMSIAIIAVVGYPHWFPSQIGVDYLQSPHPIWRLGVVLIVLGMPLLLPLSPGFAKLAQNL